MKVKVCIELDQNIYNDLMEIIEAGNRKFKDNMTLENLVSLMLATIALNKHFILDMIEYHRPPPTFAG